MSYLDRNKIISNTQYGFQPNMGTFDALSDFSNQVYKSLDQGKKVLTIFIDFKKAYDTIPHDILIKQGRTDPKCLLGARICGETREYAISNILFRLEGWPWTPNLTPLNLFVSNEICMVGSSI